MERVLKISCIICAYNPRIDYLNETLDSLRAQDYGSSNWEFILIDNNSKSPLEAEVDLSGIPNARVVVEKRQGLTNARLCGIRESSGELIVFVDDDNILSSSYFSNVAQIFDQNHILGCIGGEVVPRFGIDPPSGSEPFWECLAIRSVERIEITSSYSFASKPYGAGLSLRRLIAEEYLSNIECAEDRLSLGRTAESLGGGEDTDIAFTACDMGYGCGLFPQLHLTHLIDRKRLNWTYLKKIAFDANVSFVQFLHARGLSLPTRRIICLRWLRAFFAMLARPSAITYGSFLRKHCESKGLFKGLKLVRAAS